MNNTATKNRILNGLKQPRQAAALLALLLAPVLAHGQANNYGQQPTNEGGGDTTQIQQRLMQVQQSLQKVNTEINNVRSEAAAQPEVEEALSSYNEAMTSVMLEKAPDQSEKIKKRSDLFEKIVQATDINNADPKKLQAWNQEFISLRESLQPIEQAAEQSEPVVEARTDYSEKLTEAMVALEPNLQEKINQRNQLMQQFEQLQQQIQN